MFCFLARCNIIIEHIIVISRAAFVNMNEIFERLVQFGNENDRNLFCQRLQTIWQEQGIFCSTYPTITNQILDLYKLHQLVQEKQGYLEVTTNRGWKEISNVLGFGDSGKRVKQQFIFDITNSI